MRQVVCADAFEALAELPEGGICTSLPDHAELAELSAEAYDEWIAAAVRLCIASRGVAGGWPCLFYQTDRLASGRWVSKASRIIEASSAPLLWHKIILRRAPGRVDLFRPGFAHLLAFGHGRPGRRSADVMPGGHPVWRNGPGRGAALFAAGFIAERAPLLVDPFCGRGSFLAAANSVGLPAAGLDIDPEMCEIAARLEL